ncbi:MAG: FAD-binding oxidoreductase [Pseudomonadota bacterium]
MIVTSWNNYPKIDTTLKYMHTRSDVIKAIEGLQGSTIARGNGRCYGDGATNPNLVLSTLTLDKMVDFNEDNGLLIAEAGVTLADIVDTFAPRGWFLPVTPGTKLITLGGAIGSDVHGKNHHVAGTFGQHILWMDIITAEKGLMRASLQENTDLFHATCGGQGLTGIITQVALQLVKIPSTWIKQYSIKTKNLAEIMEAFEQYESSPFSVAWIDCIKTGEDMGRSILMCGDFASKEELGAAFHGKELSVKRPLALSIPLDFPSIALNPLSVKAFNMLYYGKAPAGTKESFVSYNSFFYPLDSIDMWNRIYGKRGFLQYQFVLPKEAGKKGLPFILNRIAKSGLGSFLAVLKLFGKQDNPKGNISFPTEGYTLALDFPISKKLFPLLDELDAIVLDYGGRHYLTKDARMSSYTFKKGYGKLLDDFLEVKALWDPKTIFTSSQSQRLF